MKLFCASPTLFDQDKVENSPLELETAKYHTVTLETLYSSRLKIHNEHNFLFTKTE